jgi:hypothetical protein
MGNPRVLLIIALLGLAVVVGLIAVDILIN